MSPTDEIVPILKKLRLSGVLQTLELRTRQAVEANLAHSEFLYRVLLDEVERRDHKQLDLRLRRASFDAHKTVEDFDFAFNPNIPKSKVIDLATCHFVRPKEVVMPAGRGRCRQEPPRAGRRPSSVPGGALGAVHHGEHQLLTTLRAARADQSYDRKLLKYTTPELLVVAGPRRNAAGPATP